MEYDGYISLERFIEHYPQGRIDRITLDDIPSTMMERFERYSKQIAPEDYRPGNFDHSFFLEKEKVRTYITSQENVFSDIGLVEKNVYLFEYLKDDNIGHGNIRFGYRSKDIFYKNKPFVGFTKTEEKFQGQGYGMNRSRVMNAISHMLFNLPLNSSTTMTDAARGVWERLSGLEEAERYMMITRIPQLSGRPTELIQERYVFVK